MNTVSLKKSAFIRLLAITLAAVFIFYGIGLHINAVGIQYVRTDLQEALWADTCFIAGELNREIETLNFFMREMMSDKDVLHFSLLYDILNDYDRLSYIRAISNKEYEIKRFSPIVDSVQIMLPNRGSTVITEQTLYNSLDLALWDALYAKARAGNVSTVEYEGKLWLILPYFDCKEPLFLIAISITPELLGERLSSIGSGRTDDMWITREDGTSVVAIQRELQLTGESPERNTLLASCLIETLGMTLTCRNLIDEMMAPFVNYRATLWVLTLLSLLLLAVYLLYYRIWILRPLNEIFRTIRQARSTGQYRLERKQHSDFDDIYGQFNEMVDHIEQLASRVYEEQYRAQRAELKQLQMQIDPHFLYNSMYLIYRIARAEGNTSIANLSANLSNYYRYITKMPEQIVYLRDEIEHVMNYMEIQRIRFEPRIHIHAQPLPEEIAQERIPSLIIQPIVENAFQHGVKDKASGGLVSLRYVCKEDYFQVIVADNSGKMDEEKVAQLWARIQSDETPDGSALRNLYRRLQLYESGDQSLELKCVDNGLTMILTFSRKKRDHKDTPDCG